MDTVYSDEYLLIESSEAVALSSRWRIRICV